MWKSKQQYRFIFNYPLHMPQMTLPQKDLDGLVEQSWGSGAEEGGSLQSC